MDIISKYRSTGGIFPPNMAGFLAQRIDLQHMTAEASQVFSSISSTTDQSDISTTFNQLHKSYRKYINRWWEIASYETYLQQGLVYRGLRIPLKPGVHQDNSEFLQGWENTLTECSLKLIEYLLQFEKKTSCGYGRRV